MNEDIEEFMTSDGAMYRVRTMLGWQEQQRIDDSAFHLFADGKAIAGMESIEDLPEIEIRIDRAAQNLARLMARLVGMSKRAILELPAQHVAQLIARIEVLEKETAIGKEELEPGNPIMKISRDSSVILSSEA